MNEGSSLLFVRVIGLEPTRLTAPDPKSGAAANYATRAFGCFVCGAKIGKLFVLANYIRLKFYTNLSSVPLSLCVTQLLHHTPSIRKGLHNGAGSHAYFTLFLGSQVASQAMDIDP